MRRYKLLYIFLCLIFTSVNYIYGNIITPKSTGGNWNQASTWNGEEVPEPGDTVRIDGASVVVDSKVVIKHIFLENYSDSGSSELIIEGSDTLTVTDDIIVVANKNKKDVTLHVRGNSTLLVQGNVDFSRTSDNDSNKLLRLYLYGQSKTFIEGNFIFDFKNGATTNTDFHINTKGNAHLEVTGKTTLITRGGTDLDFVLQDFSTVILRDSLKLLLMGGQETAITANDNSHFQLFAPAYLLNSGGSNHCKLKSGDAGGKMTITGDITMESTDSNLDIKLEAKSATAELNILGDIIMDAFDEQDLVIHIRNGATFNFGGNITRLTPFGYLKMESEGQFIFNGSEPQTIPKTKLSGSGLDSLHFGEVIFQNTSGSAIALEGDVVIRDTLFLTTGIIQTSSTALLIVEDQGVISGASKSAYIQGPIIKRGRTNGSSFLFPLGDNGVYAPIEIEAITNATLEYTAEFIGCPPPIEALNAPLTQVSQLGYWSLGRNDGNLLGNVALHWDNANEFGINDLSALVVAYSDGVTSWYSAGRNNASGNIGNQSGSINNDIGCPPPIEATLLAFGSTKGSSNPLPVEMDDFFVYLDKNGLTVNLEWVTISEMNSDYFIVEKSYDGLYFSEIARVQAAGMSNSLQTYSSEDTAPAKGNNYYRIRQVDFNRNTSLSQVVSLFINIIDDAPIIYPNPVKDHFRLYSKSLNDEEEVLIIVSDITGKAVYIGKHLPQDGQILLSTAKLSIRKPGSYFISFKSRGKAHTLEVLHLPNQ